MRILVTNDDGVDSIGLHVLARAMQEIGETVVVAPDEEYSGYGTAIGPLHKIRPEVHRIYIDGVEQAWAITGPPALCVVFGMLKMFGEGFDLVVSGINPGANVGSSVYHSGTVGACLAARNGGINGIAVSQTVQSFGIEGQGWDDLLEYQEWDTAAAVAVAAVQGMASEMPDPPTVMNINIPNLEMSEVKGWKHTRMGVLPPRSMAAATLEPRHGHADAYWADMAWGDPVQLPLDTDGGAVMDGWVSVGWLSPLEDDTANQSGQIAAENSIARLLS